ncbi:MAG: acyl carrier protein, partial [Cyanobacteria bacterium J06639_1]
RHKENAMTATQDRPTLQTTEEASNPQAVLQRYISDELLNGRVDVEVEDDLLGGGIIDSVAMMWLVTFIEETFQITVPLEDVTIHNFRTIQTIDAYLQRRKSDAAEH